MSSLQSVIVTLSVGYALIGALLLLVLVYARLPWPAKAVAVVVTSAFYVVSFVGMRGLLGWASVDRLPPSFKAAAGADRRPAYGRRRLRLGLSVGRGAGRGQPAERRSAGPTGCPTAMRWPKRPSMPRTRSPPVIRKAAAPPISAPATAA